MGCFAPSKWDEAIRQCPRADSRTGRVFLISTRVSVPLTVELCIIRSLGLMALKCDDVTNRARVSMRLGGCRLWRALVECFSRVTNFTSSILSYAFVS